MGIWRNRRVILRAPGLQDVTALLEMRGDPELQRLLMRKPATENVDTVAAWIRRTAEDPTRSVYLVASRSSDECIGFTQIAEIDQEAGRGMVGICLHPCVQGMGLGAEVMELVEQVATQKLGLNCLGLEVLGANIKAIRLYERLGYRVVSRRAGAFEFGGVSEDVIDMEKTLATAERAAA
jgi:RimJ/RimL family protein N-acetyltransferase